MSHQDNARQKILIVDDTPQNIKMLIAALRDEYTLSIATSGAEALDIAASEQPPDLILLDITMPEMDGYEVCRRLKAEAATETIPVVFLTARTEEGDETRGLELGAVDYITKPFSLAIVRARVRTHLGLKRCHDMLRKMLAQRDQELTRAEQEYLRLYRLQQG